MPGWIGFLDQSDLLRPGPVLEFLFARDGIQDVCELFAVDQSMDVVVRCVRARPRFPMGRGAIAQVVGDSDVEVAGAAGEDVDPEAVFTPHGGRIAAKARTEADSLRE